MRTQTKNKVFPQSTCLCSVYPDDKTHAIDFLKLNDIGVSLEIVIRLFFRPFVSLNILLSVYIMKAKRTVTFMREKKNHLYVDSNERSVLLHSLVELKNKLIQQGRYTDCVDELIF